jgi:hypothetical protein
MPYRGAGLPTAQIDRFQRGDPCGHCDPAIYKGELNGKLAIYAGKKDLNAFGPSKAFRRESPVEQVDGSPIRRNGAPRKRLCLIPFTCDLKLGGAYMVAFCFSGLITVAVCIWYFT